MAYCAEGGGARTVLHADLARRHFGDRDRRLPHRSRHGHRDVVAVAKWTAGNAGGDQLLPGGIAVGPDRQVYVTVFGGAADDQYVEVYAQPATGVPDGTSVTTFGELGTGNGQFKKPLGVDTDPGGNVYVSDFERSDVQTFDTDHAYQDTSDVRHSRRADQVPERRPPPRTASTSGTRTTTG